MEEELGEQHFLLHDPTGRPVHEEEQRDPTSGDHWKHLTSDDPRQQAGQGEGRRYKAR